jgi:putative ABC transport system permease protein
VVKDVKLESARDAAMPQGFILSDTPQRNLTVLGADVATARQALQDLWKAHGPPTVFDMQSVDELRAGVYRQEGQLTAMLTALAVLAVGVAMMGAYALVADTLNRRRAELVLRRLHGAGNADIAKEIGSEFLAPVLIAIAVGTPIAASLSQRYLAGFIDRVDTVKGILIPLLVAVLLTLFVTAIAAMRHVTKAMSIQPIESLE